MSFRRYSIGIVLVLAALLAMSGLGTGTQQASAASLLDHGAMAAGTGTQSTSPILAQTCCFFNQFNPFFSFRSFSPFFSFRTVNRFFPFFRPFSSFFPIFRLFNNSSQTVNCLRIMRTSTGQSFTISIC